MRRRSQHINMALADRFFALADSCADADSARAGAYRLNQRRVMDRGLSQNRTVSSSLEAGRRTQGRDVPTRSLVAPFRLPALPGSLQDGGMTNAPIDLRARAHQAMLEAGFRPDFPADVLHEVQLLKQGVPKVNGPAVRDLRSLLWSSIDNDSSRDLDQVEYVEKLPDGATRLLVGIADVDASVPKGSATDGQAAAETTSVYTGVTTFPMLPGELSTDLTSLLDAQDRLSLVIEMRVADTGEVWTGTRFIPPGCATALNWPTARPAPGWRGARRCQPIS